MTFSVWAPLRAPDAVLRGEYLQGTTPPEGSRAARNDPRIMQTEFGPESLALAHRMAEHANSPFTAEDEAFVSGLVSPGHASTAGYNDPAYPVVGRVASVG